MIYDDYIAYCKEFTEKYGPNTVVFMQVGDFFELYAVQNEEEKAGADIYRVCELCNIQVSRKNKSVLENSRSNPLMAGFPIATIHKFIQIMLQSQYTCVLIRQVTPPPNPRREVTEVISPSTTLQVSTQEGQYLMVVYWDVPIQKEGYHVGVAALDITTGKSWVYEAYSTPSDAELAKDEVVRLVSSYQPKELVFLGEVDEEEGLSLASLFTGREMTLHCCWKEEKVAPFRKPSYQNLVLEKVFGKVGIISPLESLHLERNLLATIAYCYMLQFTYEHNESILRKMEPPVHWKNQHQLVLEANSMHQLNIVATHPNETPLLTLLNRTTTAFGSRMFRERLLYPTIHKKELETRYSMIDLFLQDYLYTEISSYLQTIMDLERMSRRMGLGKMPPCDWMNFANSLEGAKKVFQRLEHKMPPLSSCLQRLQSMMRDYTDVLDIEECGKYMMADMYTSLFQKGVYADIDTMMEELESHFRFLEEMKVRISNVGTGESTLCRLDCNERDGYHLTITKKRWEQVQQLCPTNILVQEEYISWKDCKLKPLSSTSSVLRLSHPKIDTLSDAILALQRKMSQRNLEYYREYLEKFYQTYQPLLTELVQHLGEIDIYCTNARNAQEYKYQKPIILDGTVSSIHATQLRHPIIERMNLRTGYIANDVCLGREKRGLLLYGINASGKSSLMKSIGLNIVMAQAGMFVAASSMELVPYHHLFTRISGMDNIYRGLSTFTVEMLELKNILNRCDSRSLILGDELCAGTEGISAISIVAAGIDALQQSQSTFIFATHLHELLDLEFIREEPSIQVSHMHIELDPLSGKIIYDRTLKDGNGSHIYGLEVCRFLKMTDSFLEKAHEVRKRIQKQPLYLIEPKVSRYNPQMYVSSCSLCGKPASETHHIKQQKDADKDGYIGHMHKDDLSNLLVLCETCHLEQHLGKKKVQGLQMTSEGVEPILSSVMESQEVRDSYPLERLKERLMYSIQGWSYRADTTQKWKKLTSSMYEKVFEKLQKQFPSLPTQKKQIELYLQEYQSEFLVFRK